MTQRITDAQLNAKLATVNAMLGNPEDAPYPTPGVVVLYSAYGATGVHRVVNDAGGQSDLSGLGTKRETATFLDGMIHALRIVQDKGITRKMMQSLSNV